jgi:hypothetical protein
MLCVSLMYATSSSRRLQFASRNTNVHPGVAGHPVCPDAHT